MHWPFQVWQLNLGLSNGLRDDFDEHSMVYKLSEAEKALCHPNIPYSPKKKKKKKTNKTFHSQYRVENGMGDSVTNSMYNMHITLLIFFFAVLLTKLEPFSRLTSSWILSDFLRRKSESQKMLKVSIFVLGFRNELWRNSCNYAKFVKGDVQHPSLQKKIL